MVLGHLLACLVLLVHTGQLQHVDWDLGGLGEEVLQGVEGPAQWHFLPIDHLVFLIFDDDFDHASAFLVLSSLHLLLYDLLDLLFL